MGEVRLFLCGDVMTGRGIDQVLAHPGAPALHEPYVDSALDYVALAERAHGAIPRPVAPEYVWGDALDELERTRPAARIVNLETAVTRSAEWEPKGINYRMHPANVDVLTVAAIDCCALANNHVLDWGRAGLEETLDTLHDAGIATAGAGRDDATAAAPAALPLPGGGRVLVFALGHESSGIPPSWAATAGQAGVHLAGALDGGTAATLGRAIEAWRRPGDRVIVSIHWGGNWGYEVPAGQRALARALVREAGVDIVHGHSSHHPRAVEVIDGRLVLYGCGDFINDYEGIGGHEDYRGDLTLMVLPALRHDGALAACTLVPLRMRRFRLERPPAVDRDWLAARLQREYARFGTGVEPGADGRLALTW